jgi:hypothetical protein
MGSSVNDKSDSDDFAEDDGDEPAADSDEVDVDHLIRSMDRLKRRGSAGVKLSDPAWRRLERYREDKLTEELLSDFDDYDVGPDVMDSEGSGESARPLLSKKRKD